MRTGRLQRKVAVALAPLIGIVMSGQLAWSSDELPSGIDPSIQERLAPHIFLPAEPPPGSAVADECKDGRGTKACEEEKTHPSRKDERKHQ